MWYGQKKSIGRICVSLFRTLFWSIDRHMSLHHHSTVLAMIALCLCADVCVCSVASDSLTPWTIACQAPLSIEFSRQEYWSMLLFLTPGELPDPGVQPTSLLSPALAGRFFNTSMTCDSFMLTCVLSCVWLNCVWLFASIWTEAHQAPLSWGSPRKNTEVGCMPFSSDSFILSVKTR